jgi:hypothetical protein
MLPKAVLRPAPLQACQFTSAVAKEALMTDAPFNSNAASPWLQKESSPVHVLPWSPFHSWEMSPERPGQPCCPWARLRSVWSQTFQPIWLFKQPGGFVAAAFLASEGITSVRLWLHAMRTRWLFSWLR